MTQQRAIAAEVVNVNAAGTWRIYAQRPGRAPVEVTYFRGVPTGYGPWALSDPFGAKSATLTFPKITLWDQLGFGDLEWLTYGTDIDIFWDGPTPYSGGFRWEGYVVSFDFSSDTGLSLQLAGALYQADNYLAKPLFPSRPIPYEVALANVFRGYPDLRVSPLRVEFPDKWDTIYEKPAKTVPMYLRPTGVRPGQKWTGLVTRSTGSWEPGLTSYAQTLLSTMYTERGRWTIDMDTHRKPVLRHRDAKTVDTAELILDPALPGVDLSLNVDWSQSLNVAYGQGTSAAGEGYTGMLISSDGQRTTYEPLAALRQVHPITDANGWYETERMRKEVSLQMQPGLSLTQAQAVGQAHLQRYSDPGITGSITLTVDPIWRETGQHMPRALIKAGMAVRLPHVFGDDDGPILHIADVNTDLANGSVTLTVDSKFRDSLTVDEVRQRGRDSLAVVRQLIGGQYAPVIPDQLLPWNYAEGSGFIPSGPDYNAVPLFDGLPDDIAFPYEEWTTQRPPKDESWKHCYIKIDQKNPNADKNWAQRYDSNNLVLGFPIKMSQAGQIRRVQVAAYDENGNVLPVRFHISLYKSSGVGVAAMPIIMQADTQTADGYAVGQHYPFFARAWEQFQTDGTKVQNEQNLSTSSVGLVRGWGTRFVKAGYWPGSPVSSDTPTGMLVDEGVWEFNTTDFDVNFNPHIPQQVSKLSGYLYAMIYCDEQINQPVYFMGRMFRVEPGTSV